MNDAELDAIEADFRNLSAYESATRDAGLELVEEVRRLRAAADAEVLLSHTVVDWAAEAIEQAQVRGRVRIANRLGPQGRASAARAVLDVARAALLANQPSAMRSCTYRVNAPTRTGVLAGERGADDGNRTR